MKILFRNNGVLLKNNAFFANPRTIDLSQKDPFSPWNHEPARLPTMNISKCSGLGPKILLRVVVVLVLPGDWSQLLHWRTQVSQNIEETKHTTQPTFFSNHELRHEKTDLKIFWYDTDYEFIICSLHRLCLKVSVVPKEGLAGPGPAILLLLWQRQRS